MLDSTAGRPASIARKFLSMIERKGTERLVRELFLVEVSQPVQLRCSHAILANKDGVFYEFLSRLYNVWFPLALQYLKDPGVAGRHENQKTRVVVATANCGDLERPNCRLQPTQISVLGVRLFA